MDGLDQACPTMAGGLSGNGGGGMPFGVCLCSPSYVTTSIAGSSFALSTCFLAGQPRTVLHL